MTEIDPLKKSHALPVTLSLIAGAALVAVIGWGLWIAAHPAKAPLQGQINARSIDVAPKIAGRLAAVSVREGDLVSVGDVMARIDIPELTAKVGQIKAQQEAAAAQARLVDEGAREEQIRAAKAQYERAATGASLAQKTYARINSLYKEGLISAQKHDEAYANLQSSLNLMNAAKSQYDMAVTGARKDEKVAAASMNKKAEEGVAEVTSLASEADVKAPVAGEISRVVLHAGEVVPTGFPVITILDHSDKWATFNIREDELPGIQIGTEFTATVPALAKDIKFKVYWISPRAEYATWRSTRQSTGYDVRTFEVRARTEHPMQELRPGMSVLVNR